jgi:predicted cupin superfamily sugar epimerase
MTAQQIIDQLQLAPLTPEGGFFRRTFEDSHFLDVDGRRRRAATCIYYLLNCENFSAFHRVRGTEIFHFLRGDPAEMITLSAGGARVTKLGPGVERGETPQFVVQPLEWQALRSTGWTLFSCTVSPGFEFEDFELGNREKLLAEFPSAAAEIRALTR